MTSRLKLAGLLIASLTLVACSKPVDKTEDIRPVRAFAVAESGARAEVEFSGEVMPRYESRIAFRVGGKVVARKVEVGSVVKRGQVLLQLDPSDLELSQAQSRAVVAAADSGLGLAKADLERYRELRQKNFVSQAVLDAKEASYKSALAARDQATAGMKAQVNQSSYTQLLADADGVITGLDVEVGQVVAAGSPVVRIARLGEVEVRVSIPENQWDSVRQAKDISVRTWANPAQSVSGRLREISPMADAATRTFTAKIALTQSDPSIRLGMTAVVAFGSAAPVGIRLPLTALFQNKEATSVWVVANQTVSLVPVQVGGAIGNEVLIASGLKAGQVVVTAGVNQLREGQKVIVLGQELKDAQAAAAQAALDSSATAQTSATQSSEPTSAVATSVSGAAK